MYSSAGFRGGKYVVVVGEEAAGEDPDQTLNLNSVPWPVWHPSTLNPNHQILNSNLSALTLRVECIISQL